MGRVLLQVVRAAIVAGIATSVVGCGSGSATGSPAQASTGSQVPVSSVSSASSAAAPGGSQAIAHTAAIKPCDLIDESTMSTLAGYPVKYFGPGDPVARVPFADQATVNTKGAAIRVAGCGYWETGVKPELSRDVTIEVTQGDPAKPGSWSADAASSQFAILRSNAAAPPQAVSGLGDEAYSVTTAGFVTLFVRAGDLIVRVDAGTPPDTQMLTVETLKAVAAAVLGKV